MPSRNRDVPLATDGPPRVLPGDSLVSLESVLCTGELTRRPSRPPDFETENGALVVLAQALADSPDTILQRLAETMLEVFKADSAGISLLTKDGKRFFWPAIAGMWRPHLGGGTPRDFGPCGDVLDCDAPLLFTHFERRYAYFLPVVPPVEECLLVPFRVHGKTVGTIWAIAHDDRRKFDAEDLRQLESLGRFASASYQLGEERQKVHDSRRAALNLMEDAVQSRQAMGQLNLELRESERRFRDMIDAVPAAVYTTDAEGCLTHVNPAAVTFSGRTPELGKDRWCVSWKLFRADGSPLPHEESPLAIAIKEGRAVRGEEIIAERPDGERRWVEPYPTRLRDADGRVVGGINMLVDITARKTAEAEREDMLAIAEHAREQSEGVGNVLRRVQAITDTALLKLSFDDLLRAVLERVRDSLQGDTAVILLRRLPEEKDEGEDEEEDVLHARAAVGLDEDVRRLVRVPFGRGFDGRVAAEEAPIILDEVDYANVISPYIRDKGLRSLVGVPLLTEGRLLGVLQVGSVQPRKFSQMDVDILVLAAERIAHAVEVAARRESEQRARASAEAANRAKDEFLALLSHELRNPLSAVRHAVTAARLDPSSRERALEIAGRQSEHLTRLVDDLLDVARITQGKIRLRRERVVLRDAVTRAIEGAQAILDGCGHTLSVVCSSEGAVDADPARIEQIVENLVTNAAKYTASGGRIEIEIERSRGEMVLRVRDNGMGIPEEMLSRVFDLFSQGDTRLDRLPGGLGIGLTVVRRLVELHGGRIEARSEGAGRGSEFIVRLPALSPGDAEAPVQPRVAETVSPARVLVVEDNRDAAESLQMLLELFGHGVRVAHDGPAALDAARAEAPDIVLMDIGLPGMSGYEVVRHLREQPGMEGATLVALSGYGRDEDKEAALAAGFHLHLTKPIDPDRLQALLGGLNVAKAPS